MNTDIRVSISFKGHRKRIRLKKLLGLDVTGCIIDLWITAAMERPEGVFFGLDEIDIAIMAGWEGDAKEFCEALVQFGFLDHEDGVYSLHDWKEHNTAR